jgi:hypothetical protein
MASITARRGRGIVATLIACRFESDSRQGRALRKFAAVMAS